LEIGRAADHPDVGDPEGGVAIDRRGAVGLDQIEAEAAVDRQELVGREIDEDADLLGAARGPAIDERGRALEIEAAAGARPEVEADRVDPEGGAALEILGPG